MEKKFRSTGSYEPDLVGGDAGVLLHGFDPQALTSLTCIGADHLPGEAGFDPQALTSLTGVAFGT